MMSCTASIVLWLAAWLPLSPVDGGTAAKVKHEFKPAQPDQNQTAEVDIILPYTLDHPENPGGRTWVQF